MTDEKVIIIIFNLIDINNRIAPLTIKIKYKYNIFKNLLYFEIKQIVINISYNKSVHLNFIFYFIITILYLFYNNYFIFFL